MSHCFFVWVFGSLKLSYNTHLFTLHIYIYTLYKKERVNLFCILFCVAVFISFSRIIGERDLQF